LRTVLVIAIALCLTMQAVLGSLSEIHETAEHGAAVATLSDHHSASDHVHPADPDAPSDDDPWHVLLHQAQCSAHTVALVGTGLGPTSTALPSLVARPLPPSPLHSAQSANPFRPPILA
jgi:hypothetical protein